MVRRARARAQVALDSGVVAGEALVSSEHRNKGLEIRV